ncbi:MAG: hypothetical protein WBA54_02520 [Acidaminobacteraceae bacterium]
MYIRKSLIIVVILSMIFGIVEIPSFAATDITVNSVNPSISTIYEGNTYNLVVNFNRDGSVVSIDEVTLSSSSTVTPTDGILTKAYSSPNALTNITYSVKQVSDGDTVSFNIKYTNAGGAQTTTVTFVIPGVQKNSTATSSAPTNTIKYKPILKIDQDGNIPTFKSANAVNLEFTVENTSAYSAKDLNLTLVLADGKEYPFIKNGKNLNKYIKIINKKEKLKVSIPVEISPTAISKVHEFTVKANYTNSFGDAFENTDYKYYFRISNTNVVPIIASISTSFKEDEIVAGIADVMVLNIQNKGTIIANDVSITLSGFSKDSVRLNDDVNVRFIPSLNGGKSSKVYFGIIASENVKSGIYELDAIYKALDDNGKEYETKGKIYIPVSGKDPKSIELNIEKVSAPKLVKSGDEFEITFDISNAGKIDAADTEISIEYPEGVIPTSSPKEYIKEFKSGETRSLTFKFKAKDDAKTGHGDYYINTKYNVKGMDEADSITMKEYIGQYVEGSSGLGRPKIIIEDFDFGAERVLAGDEFDLLLTLFNTSNDEYVKNIKVKIESADGIFTPVDSSSSVFVESIGRRDVINKTIRLKTKNTADVKTYNLDITMEYEDSKGNAYDSQEQAYKETEKITIPVSQPIKLEIANINPPMSASVGRPIDLAVEFYNMGKSTMYNMMVRAEGDFEMQGGSNFIGDFEAGRTQYFEPSFYVDEPGDYSGKIVFSYEDASGVAGTLEKEFNFYVEDGSVENNGGEVYPGGEDAGNGGEDMKAPMNPLVKWGLISSLILATIVALVVLKKRKNRNRLALLEAEDDDE